jgi:nucleotidyltransferase substrate binding protein (TIGR01987 family)
MTSQTASDKPRWLYRFDHYTSALAVLRDDVQTMRTHQFSDREKRGVIQSFEFTWELAWKLMKDYLEQMGLHLEIATPAAVIREAFVARLIENGDLWMQALNARSRTLHMYDLKTFEKILADISTDYLPLFEALQRKLLPRPKEE